MENIIFQIFYSIKEVPVISYKSLIYLAYVLLVLVFLCVYYCLNELFLG